jgi:hypothetical protein
MICNMQIIDKYVLEAAQHDFKGKKEKKQGPDL